MRKRVFSKALANMTLTIRLSTEMIEIIEKLAEEEGESRNGYIVLALDEYLQLKAEAGEIPWPKGMEPKSAVIRKK